MSDKTYAETQGQPPFDWWHALNNPDQYSHMVLRLKAGEWTTCACGNQCAIIERHEDSTDDHPAGMPKDGLLAVLGTHFYAYVCEPNWDAAKVILEKIEQRSAILIREELERRTATHQES